MTDKASKKPSESSQFNDDNEVNFDSELKLSSKNLVEEIRWKIKIKKLPNFEKLKLVREFPTPETLSVFADKAYNDYEVLKDSKLPEGWKLLTTATNNEMSNGYAGAAFIHSENHHVVVAHRGTQVSNVGALAADLGGIVFNSYAGQLESACTFLDKVVKAMQIIEKEYEGDVHFELFITGHSLGAWLSQVTAFSNKFLKRDKDKFVRIMVLGEQRYHAQAVVFDSPGGLPMLLRMKTKFETVKNPIDLENLSITSYLSAPNQVNTCNEHFGKVFRVFIDTSKMSTLDRNIKYTLTTHSIVNIVKAFEAKNDIRIEEVLEWPVRKGVAGGEELNNFLKYADSRNGFHINYKIKEGSKVVNICYKTRKVDKTLTPISVFNKREKQFLEHFRWIKQMPEYSKFKKILSELEFSDEIEKNLGIFDIVDQDVRFENSDKMKLFIPYIKLFMKLFPQLAKKIETLLMDDSSVRAKIFAFETKISLAKDEILDFKPSTIDFSEFFKNQFSKLKVKIGKARNGLSLIYNNIQKSESEPKYADDEVLVLDIKRFLMMNELINIKDFLAETNEKFLMIFHYPEKEFLKDATKNLINSILESLTANPKVKLIMVGDSENKNFNEIGQLAMKKLDNQFYEIEKSLSWNQMTEESHERVLSSKIMFQEGIKNLKTFLILNDNFKLNDKVLQQLLNYNRLEVNMQPLVSSDFFACSFEHNNNDITTTNILEVLQKSDDIFYISGLYDIKFKMIVKNLKDIFQPQDKLQESLIEQNIVIADENIDESRGKLHIISIVGSERCLQHFDDKCRINISDKNIHWIKIKDGKLSWRKSYNFDAYVNRKLKMNGQIKDDVQMSEIKDKIVVVISRPGGGKSSFLTHFAREKMKTSWIVCLNFKDLSFHNLKTDSLNHESFAAFIANSLGYDSDNHLQSFLLLANLHPASMGQKPIHFLLDGFDEISDEKDRSKALKMMKFIRDKTNCCITLTSQESFMNALNDLQPTICNFEKMQRPERESLLREFWRSRFALVWGPKKCAEVFDGENSRFKSFAKILFDQLDSNIDGKAGEVMGIPQQLRLLAEGFQEDFDKFIRMSPTKQKIFKSIKSNLFFKQYISSKFDLYVTGKMEQTAIDQKSKGLLKVFQNISNEAKDLVFKHSEFFSSDYIILQMTKGQPPQKVLSIFLEDLLVEPKFVHLRVHLNNHKDLLPNVESFDINDETSQTILGKPLIVACKEGNDMIVKYLIELLKGNPDLKNVELGTDESQKNALDYAINSSEENCVTILKEFLIKSGDTNESKKTVSMTTETATMNSENCNGIDVVEKINNFLLAFL
jgi:hypothetical protein